MVGGNTIDGVVLLFMVWCYVSWCEVSKASDGLLCTAEFPMKLHEKPLCWGFIKVLGFHHELKVAS